MGGMMSMGGMGGMGGMGKNGKNMDGIEEMGIMTTNFAWEMSDEVSKDGAKGQSWSQLKTEKEDASGWFASLLKGLKEENPAVGSGAAPAKAAKPTLKDLLTGKWGKASSGGRALAAGEEEEEEETNGLPEALSDQGEWASDLADTLSDS
jgi:hypothetical protein